MPISASIYRIVGTTGEIYPPSKDVIHLYAGKSQLLIVNIAPTVEIHNGADLPPAMLVDGYLAGTKRIVPAGVTDDDEWDPLLTAYPYGRAIFGGAFVYSSDYRWPFQHPLPLHDRYETPEFADVVPK